MAHVFETFRLWIKTNHLQQQPLIVACSGGIDSVVLCELCYQAQVTFSIAHCNFGLRGAESNRDEAFVTSLGVKYSVPVFVKTFDTEGYGLLKKLSIQEAARELRYQWFEALRIEKKAAFVLLAHHANDNIETMLMHLFRGTGLHGLTGMPERVENAYCLRPLLQQTRRSIEAFAAANGLQWVDDSSNASSKYTRNFFRNELIPAIQNIYPQAEENLLHTIERLKQTEALYQLLTDGLLKKILLTAGVETKLPVSKLIQFAHTSLPYEVLKKFGFGEKQVPELLKLAQAQSGSYLQNETFRIIKHGKWLIFSPQQVPEIETIVIEKETKRVRLSIGELQLKTIGKEHFHLDKSPAVAQLDASAIQFPLIMRRWKQGDYFYPLGMRKKKKIARFLIDLKLSTTEKENTWVLESHARILWVVGYRIDDRFKVTDHTNNILQLTFSRHY
jgi:tRNA(Ile)-lysidine synthase